MNNVWVPLVCRTLSNCHMISEHNDIEAYLILLHFALLHFLDMFFTN